MAKTKKLTESQKAALGLLADGRKDYFDLVRAGANASTRTSLTSRGLAEKTAERHPGGFNGWQITDKGREALQAGRVEIQT